MSEIVVSEGMITRELARVKDAARRILFGGWNKRTVEKALNRIEKLTGYIKGSPSLLDFLVERKGKKRRAAEMNKLMLSNVYGSSPRGWGVESSASPIFSRA